MNRFTELISGLPQELHDQIYDQVFHPNTNEVKIDKSYTTPVQMQVSHSPREKFAQIYYAGTSFTCFQEDITSFKTCDRFLQPWLRSLSRSHIALIRHISIMGVVFTSDDGLESLKRSGGDSWVFPGRTLSARWRLRELNQWMEDQDFKVSDDIIRVGDRYVAEGGREFVVVYH